MTESGTGSDADLDSAGQLADAVEANGLSDIRASLQGARPEVEPQTWWTVAAEALRIIACRRGPRVVVEGLLPWKSPREFWSFRPILEVLLPGGPFSTEDVLAVFDATPPSVFSDRAIGTYASIFRSWARCHPTEADQLFEPLAASSEPDRSFLLLPLAEGIVDAVAKKGHEEAKLRRLLSSLASSKEEKRLQVYLALTPLLVEHGYLPEEEVFQLLRRTISPLASEAVAATARVTVRFLWRRVKTRTPLHVLLRLAAENPRSLVRLHLAEVLFHAVADSGDAESRALFEDLLASFASTDEAHHAIVDKIAWTLFGVAKRMPELALRFLREWILHRPPGALYLWDSKRFLHVLSELPPGVLVPEMIRWLLAGSGLEDAGFATLTKELELSNWPPGTASSLPDTELKALVLVLSTHDDNERAVDLLFSLTAQIKAQRDLGGFCEVVEQCLTHAVANHRGHASERVQRLRTAAHPTLRAAAKRLGELDATLTSVQQLAASLRELAPPADRSRLWERIEAARNAKLMRRVKQDDPGRTPSHHLLPKVQVLAPGSFFFAREGQLTGPIPLRTHSVSFELPRLFVIDPHSEIRRRVHLRGLLKDLRSSGSEA